MQNETNYYWVNQGQEYPTTKDYIAAPYSKHEGHRILKNVKEGDKILSYVSSHGGIFRELTAISEPEKFSKEKQKDDKSISNNQQKKYWIYQPREQGILWNDVYENNIIAIGWEELGDLKQYNSKEDLAESITNIYSKKGYPVNDILANWEFANIMNIGDIVYVKKDKHFDIKLKPIFKIIAENQHKLIQKFVNNRTL